jgi:hypothetical protein
MKTSTKLILTALIIMFTVSFSFVLFDIIEPRITGNALVGTTLIITDINDLDCDINFEPGWNLVSFPCMSDEYEMEQFFNYSINDTNSSTFYDTIKYYYVLDKSDPWKSYKHDLPNWTVQDYVTVSRSKGYWIYVQNSSTFFFNGTLRTPTSNDLKEGWNLIGYPSLNSKTMNDTFGELIPDFDFVEVYNVTDTSDPWKQWTWNSSLTSNQDVNYTNKFLGYWIFMHENLTLTII